MIKIDLVTGFLGSGKTTFIKKYARYLMDRSVHIAILENDHGPINVDMALLSELRGDHCEIEMIAGGCDKDCHIRRFKTKLISLAMLGYERIIVEPSGVFDTDEFFDILREDPLDKWYEIGNVFAIVDKETIESASGFSLEARYLLASQICSAGRIVLSHVEGLQPEEARGPGEISDCKRLLQPKIIPALQDMLSEIKCTRTLRDRDFFIKDWQKLSVDDFDLLLKSSYSLWDFEKQPVNFDEVFQSLFYMNVVITTNELTEICRRIFTDEKAGKVIRIKGVVETPEGNWQEINATVRDFYQRECPPSKSVIIIIGESLDKEYIRQFWPKDVVTV